MSSQVLPGFVFWVDQLDPVIIAKFQIRNEKQMRIKKKLWSRFYCSKFENYYSVYLGKLISQIFLKIFKIFWNKSIGHHIKKIYTKEEMDKVMKNILDVDKRHLL